jgi:hypothetical protein
MVRLARLSWTDHGPISLPCDRTDWGDDREPDERRRKRLRRLRTPGPLRRRNSPIDRSPAANAPSGDDHECAAGR